MEITTILVIISFLIVLISFIIGVIIFKLTERKKAKEEIRFNSNIESKHEKQQIDFFSNEVSNLFKKQKKEYLNIDEKNIEIKIGELNKKFTNELKEIINSSQYKAIVTDKNNDFYEKAEFLNKIVKESPFVWRKKFGEEIEKYYG